MGDLPKNYLKAYIATFRAIHLWFHSAHNVTRGAGFAGDHAILYHEIYTNFQDDIDAIIEKAIGLTEDESMACPISITSDALTIMQEYTEPWQLDALGIAAMGERMIRDYLTFSTDIVSSALVRSLPLTFTSIITFPTFSIVGLSTLYLSSSP